MQTSTECENFMRNVTYLRKILKLSKTAMAKLLGISVQSLNKIELGILPNINIRIFYCIRKNFGLTPKQMLTAPLDCAKKDEM